MKNKQQETKKISDIFKIDDAIEKLPSLSTSKFIGTVNIDIKINLKEKQKKEVIRGSLELPNNFGEAKKVIAICEEKDEKKAKSAGAIDAGLETLVEKIMQNKINFDVVVATPEVMTKIVKLGKVLGPKGLMPNPKNGTIDADIERAVKSFVAGRINFKSQDDQGVIRSRIAKLDMSSEQIKENLIAFLKSIFAETKKYSGVPFKQVIISPTMGTGLKLDIGDIMLNIKN